MSLYDEAILIQKPSGYKAEKLYNVVPSPEVTEQSSLEFDGVDDCLITDGDDVAQPTTYSFWAKSSETGTNKGLFGHGGEDKCAFHFNWGDKPLLYLGGGYIRYWDDTSAQDDGKWHHWVLYSDTNDITNCKLYCDGVLQNASTTYSFGSLNAYTEALTIGGDKQSSGNYFNGSISDFAVFSRELNQSDVTEIYNYGSPNDLLLESSYGTNISQSSTKSVEFDGVDDYLNCGNSSALSFASTNPFSVSVWVYFDSINSTTIIGKGAASTSDYEYRLFTDGSGVLIFSVYNPTASAYIGRKYTIGVSTGKWYHIVGKYNGGTSASALEVYINGVAVSDADYGTGTFTGMTDNNADVIIGHYNTDYFNGSIDNVGIYDKALTQAEVTRQYNGGQPIDLSTDATSDSLVAYYQMGDGTLDEYPLIADQTDATLGSEEVVNGDFSTDSDWVKGTGWSISSGTANCNNTSGSTQDLKTEQRILNLGGKIVKIEFTVSNYSGSENMTVTLQGTGGNDFTGINANGTYTAYASIAPSDNSIDLFFKARNGWIGSIDNVSIKQVQGNPATMTNMSSSDITTDVALSVVNDLDLYYQMGNGILDDYPLIADQTNATLGSELVTNGDFATGVSEWNIGSGTLAWNSEGKYAEISASGTNPYLYDGLGVSTANTIYTISFKVRSEDYSGDMTAYIGGTAALSGKNVTPEWQTFEYNYVQTDTSGTFYIQTYNSLTGTIDVDDISVKRVQGNPAAMTNMSSDDIVAWTPNIETDFDVARSSTTTRRNASGYIEDVAANVPRLNYDSGDSCPYLLTEAASTNLITYPITFGNSYWTKSGATIEGDASTAGSELVTNGDFANGSTGWNLGSATVISEMLNFNAVPTSTLDNCQLAVMSVGTLYYVSFEISNYTGGGIRTNTSFDLDITYDSDGTHSFYAIAANTGLYLKTNGTTTLDIDNVSVKEVTGFEAPKEIPTVGSELVENGTFTTPVTEWTETGATTGGGICILDQDAVANPSVLQTLTDLNLGKYYLLTYDIVDNSLLGVNPKLVIYANTLVNTTIEINSDVGVDKKVYLFADGANKKLQLRVLNADAGSTITFTNVSVKEVTSYSGGGFEREAYKLVEDTSNGRHWMYSGGLSVTNATVYNVSVYAKKGERNWIRLENRSSVGLYVDLENKVFGAEIGGVINKKITELSNDWVRIDYSYETTSTLEEFYIYVMDADNGYSYQGDGTSGLYIAYAQLEQQESATSLMLPTTEGSTTSRVADAITNAGNQSLFSGVNSSGVLYAETAALSDDLTDRIIGLNDGSQTNSIRLGYNTTTNQMTARIIVASTTYASFNYTITDITSFSKCAFKWNENDFALWIDGVEVATDTSGSTFPASTLSELDFNGGSGTRPFYGKTKALAVFDYLSDAEMVTLTT